jgi:lactoylglutathione lyase
MALIHTCYRITDVDKSVAFYRALGFEEVGRLPIRDEAINVFMNQPGDGDMPRLELTFNHGQTDPYDLGTGYGHIAITSDDLDCTLAREAAVHSSRGREPALFRQRSGRLSRRDHRTQLEERASGDDHRALDARPVAVEHLPGRR